jgi:hypothetical protein
MSEPTEQDEATEPTVTDVPEPDQDETTELEEAESEQAETHDAEPESEPSEVTEGDEGEPENVGTQASAKQQRDEQKMVEKMFVSFDKEAERHSNRVSEIGGESAQDLLPCPMCTPDEGQPRIPGFLLPIKPSDEKIANVRAAIGLAPKIDYREDPHSKACPTCGGLRSVVPAGMDAAALTLPCADCQSQGWVPTDEVRGGTRSNGEVQQNVTFTPAGAPQLDPDAPEVAALKAAGYTVIAPYRAEA